MISVISESDIILKALKEQQQLQDLTSLVQLQSEYHKTHLSQFATEDSRQTEIEGSKMELIVLKSTRGWWELFTIISGKLFL